MCVCLGSVRECGTIATSKCNKRIFFLNQKKENWMIFSERGKDARIKSTISEPKQLKISFGIKCEYDVSSWTWTVNCYTNVVIFHFILMHTWQTSGSLHVQFLLFSSLNQQLMLSEVIGPAFFQLHSSYAINIKIATLRQTWWFSNIYCICVKDEWNSACMINDEMKVYPSSK